ncbi:MAG: hypothetical protein OXK76_09100 [Gammaproteobacteria bacterium]|nr:hypothetical protein [Gammaproteobacteria bacterium]
MRRSAGDGRHDRLALRVGLLVLSLRERQGWLALWQVRRRLRGARVGGKGRISATNLVERVLDDAIEPVIRFQEIASTSIPKCRSSRTVADHESGAVYARGAWRGT